MRGTGPGPAIAAASTSAVSTGATPCSPLHGVAPVDIGRGVVLEAIGWTGPVQPFFIPLLDGAPGRTRAPVRQSAGPLGLVRGPLPYPGANVADRPVSMGGRRPLLPSQRPTPRNAEPTWKSLSLIHISEPT